MMDVDEVLQETFSEYLTNNNIDDATDTHFDIFKDMAENRIQEIMSGGIDDDEAIEQYLEEDADDDLRFILEKVED